MVLLNEASAIYAGDSSAQKVYLGNTLVWEPGSTGPPWIMTTAGQDGDWVTRGWGKSGYVIATSPTTQQLPAGVTFANSGTQHTWLAATTHSSAIRRPDGLTGDWCCWYAGGVQTQTLTFSAAWKGTIRAYFMSSTPDSRSQQMDLLLNGVVKSTFILNYTLPEAWYGTGVESPPMLPGGRWLAWDIDAKPGDVMVLQSTHIVGGNGVVSGLIFDEEVSVPSWTPASIPGLGLWLEADKITGVSDGGSISSWPDASGNNRHAYPMATAPMWRQTGFNGKPSVEFTSSPSRTLIVQGWGTALSGKNEYTMFQVLVENNNASYPVITSAPTNQTWWWLTEAGPNGSLYWGQPAGTYRLYSDVLPNGRKSLLTYSMAVGPTPNLYRDGVLMTGFSGSIDSPVVAIGADVNFGGYYNNTLGITGHVAALLWYDHALTDAERLEVENYLKTKYSIS